jgi:hypothetical protein
MPDWKRSVREHLPPLQLDAEREMSIRSQNELR